MTIYKDIVVSVVFSWPFLLWFLQLYHHTILIYLVLEIVKNSLGLKKVYFNKAFRMESYFWTIRLFLYLSPHTYIWRSHLDIREQTASVPPEGAVFKRSLVSASAIGVLMICPSYHNGSSLVFFGVKPWVGTAHSEFVCVCGYSIWLASLVHCTNSLCLTRTQCRWLLY